MPAIIRTHAVVHLVLAVAAVPPLAADKPATPYAGQQARTIKSLSKEDIAALLNGKGMGMAKAAELNGYPGPVHLLELVQQLRGYGEQMMRRHSHAG